ncbi:MAG: hypothetical protein Q8K45_14130 [Rubrivivax sp.]|nr:hypothetical protein [Rubrivivax sp.]
MAEHGEAPGRPTDPLANRVGAAVDAAAAVVAVCRDAEKALRPIIGTRGVVALFNRSAHLAAAAHPWLAMAAQDPAAPLDLDALRALFLAHGTPQALAAGRQLFDELHRLLEQLIGQDLTERLMRTAWGPPGAPPPKDRTP